MADIVESWAEMLEDVGIRGTGTPLPTQRIYGFLQWTLVPMLRLFLRIRPRGLERVPAGGTIIAANHLSHVDPVVIISTLRKKLHYLAKDEHFTTPGVSFVVKATGQIKTERESGAADALARASDILYSGRSLGIFPEGTRSKRTEAPFLLPGKTGVARLAASHPDIPVVPVALVGTREVMAPKIHRIPRFWRRMDLNVGHPMTWNSFLEQSGTSIEELEAIKAMEEHDRKAAVSSLYRDFTDEIMKRIEAEGAP